MWHESYGVIAMAFFRIFQVAVYHTVIIRHSSVLALPAVGYLPCKHLDKQ